MGGKIKIIYGVFFPPSPIHHEKTGTSLPFVVGFLTLCRTAIRFPTGGPLAEEVIDFRKYLTSYEVDDAVLVR